MRNFFANQGSTTFEMFGTVHILLILITFVIAILLYFFRDKLKKFKYKENVRYIMGTILLLNFVIYYLGMILTGTCDFKNNLPLHLCFITNFFMIYILFSGNKKIYKIVYFFTFIGPLPAIIWTDLKNTFDVYVFYQFIISHHVMILTSLYLLFVLDYKVEKKYMIPAIVIGYLYVGLMAIINNIFGTNYVMLTSLPDNVLKLYPILQKIPAILSLSVAAITAFLISYIPAYIVNKSDEKSIKLIETRN